MNTFIIEYQKMPRQHQILKCHTVNIECQQSSFVSTKNDGYPMDINVDVYYSVPTSKVNVKYCVLRISNAGHSHM